MMDVVPEDMPVSESAADERLEATLRDALVHGVAGHGAHVDPARALDALDWRLAGRRIEGAPYTIQQIAHHILFWNGFCASALSGHIPPRPPHDGDSWPGPEAPQSEAEWELFTNAYRESLLRLADVARRGPLTAPPGQGEKHPGAEWLRSVLQHTSYHVGQIALLRRLMGSWPPPGGGDTW